MTTSERRRTRIRTRVLMGERSMADGGAEFGQSERQLWRQRAAFVRAGPTGLLHGNRGRVSSRRIEFELRARIVHLRERYRPLNDSHLASYWPSARRSPSAARGGARSCAPRAPSSGSMAAATIGSRLQLAADQATCPGRTPGREGDRSVSGLSGCSK